MPSAAVVRGDLGPADMVAHCPAPAATDVVPRCRDGRCYGELPYH